MTLVSTPEGIAMFRLMSLKGRLKLEKVGLKASGSTGSTRKKIAAEFGLKPRDSYDMFIAAVQAEIDKGMP